MANPVQFINQVRAEAAKITWPTRREVITTTIMVMIMAALTSVFFFLVDEGRVGVSYSRLLVGSSLDSSETLVPHRVVVLRPPLTPWPFGRDGARR